MISFAALLTLSLLGGAPAGSGLACEYRQPVITVTEQLPEPVMDRSQSSAALSGLMGASLPGMVHRGVTSSTTIVQPAWRILSQEIAPDVWCTNIASINVTLGISEPVRVYIASDVEPGSCVDRVTIEHEQLHVNHLYESHWDKKAAIEERLPDIIAQLMPMKTTNPDQVNEYLKAALGQRLDEVTGPIERQRQLKDMSIDTPQSYRALSARCP